MIEFPGLWGLKFQVSRIAFQMFGISIYWYGIIIAAGFMAAIILAMRHCKDFGIEQDNIIDLVLFTVPAAIIGARLYYVAFSWNEFKDDFWSIFNTRRGGLAIYGGVLAAFAVAYFFVKWKKIPIWRLFDFGIVYIPLGQAIGRWGNFINQEAFGTNTTLPWGMTGDEIKNQLLLMQMRGMNVTPDLPVHPTFLYESLWNLGVFFLLLWSRKRSKVPGETFFMYMILYGAGRFWIEGLRTDSLMLGSFRISQLLALMFVIVFTAVVIVRRKKLAETSEGIPEAGSSKYGNILKILKEEDVGADSEDKVKTDDEGKDNISPENSNTTSEESFSNEEENSGSDKENDDSSMK